MLMGQDLYLKVELAAKHYPKVDHEVHRIKQWLSRQNVRNRLVIEKQLDEKIVRISINVDISIIVFQAC